MEYQYYVYIVGNTCPTLYIGVTNNLVRRVYEHKQGSAEGFTKQYGLKNLYYYEVHADIKEAIIREKQVKKWKREWKLNLIRNINPSFRDLYADIVG